MWRPMPWLALFLVGCAPLPLIQDARLVRKGKVEVGLAGTAMVSLRPNTTFEPDGEGTGAGEDYQYIPLPALAGWARVGFGPAELYIGFQVPSFSVSVGGKVGIVGTDPDSDHAFSIAADASISPIVFGYGVGGSLLGSFRVAPGLSLDIGCRAGTFPAFWESLVLTPTVGLTISREDSPDDILVTVGGMIGVLEDPLPALWLAVGYSY